MPVSKSISKPEASEAGFYKQGYKGKRSWFTAIKRSNYYAGKNVKQPFPCFNRPVAGIAFLASSQRPVDDEDGDGTILSLGHREAGGFALATFKQIEKVLDRIKWYVVRWETGQERETGKKAYKRAQIIDLMAESHIVINQKAESTGYSYDPKPGDEPFVDYAVLLPKDRMHEFGDRESLSRFPTIGQLLSELRTNPRADELDF